MNILVTGATGYVGARLTLDLIQSGHSVTCMVRGSRDDNHFPGARIVHADALQPLTLPRAMEGAQVAYYLIHSMAQGERGFEDRDRTAAKNFAIAAREANIKRIIYLGALGSESSELSPHLKSRQDTGSVLRQFGPPLTEFRAAVIVGSGSISFEMIRYLTERLPIMICPRWVTTKIQPIGIDDVIAYLSAALDIPESANQIIEIGGSTVDSYRAMMLQYARLRGLKRWLIRVPVLTPRLSSYWLDLVTPIPASISRPLIEGLRSEVICHSHKAQELFPSIHPVSYEEAVASALRRPPIIDIDSIRDTKAIRPDRPRIHRLINSEGMIVDMRERRVPAMPEQLFKVFQDAGGSNRWFFANWLWRFRALIDTCAGGVGMRGRRDLNALHIGDTCDFWQVEALVPGRLLRFRAEMKLPGRAWLQFESDPVTPAETRFRSTAFFEPRGLAGHLYWWALYPIHSFIFDGMNRKIAALASRAQLTAGRTNKA